MSFRYGRRHIEECTRRYIDSSLLVLGWTDPSQINRPFQTPGQTSVITEFTGLDGSRPVATGTNIPLVSVALPDDGPDVDQEVGGPAAQTTYDFFVSVIAAPALVGVLTEDIVDLLAGRTARPVIPFVDIATGDPVDELLELQDVSSARARSDRDDWMLITGTIVRTFNRSWS